MKKFNDIVLKYIIGLFLIGVLINLISDEFTIYFVLMVLLVVINIHQFVNLVYNLQSCLSIITKACFALLTLFLVNILYSIYCKCNQKSFSFCVFIIFAINLTYVAFMIMLNKSLHKIKRKDEIERAKARLHIGSTKRWKGVIQFTKKIRSDYSLGDIPFYVLLIFVIGVS